MLDKNRRLKIGGGGLYVGYRGRIRIGNRNRLN